MGRFCMVFWTSPRVSTEISMKEWFEPTTTCLTNLYYLYEKPSKKLPEPVNF